MLRVLLLLALATPAAAQAPPIGVVDFYGLRRVGERDARAALGIVEGDSVAASALATARQRLRALPGVADARVSLVCCADSGRAILFVGVVERGEPTLAFRAAPKGRVRLPDDVTRAGAELDEALEAAIRRGDVAEDDSQGHALMHDSAARAIQERFVGVATRHLARLRDVLRHSADARQRALAAQVLGYAPDKRAVVPDLVRATRDPDAGVRNDAARALMVIARYAARHPEAGIRIAPAPFVAMLTSPVWTDRNKSSFALMELTASRDPALLAALRARALPSLVDIARWKSRGHAVPGVFILGRIAGLSEEEIQKAWDRDDREAVIAAATGRAPRLEGSRP